MRRVLVLTAYFMLLINVNIFAGVEVPKHSWDLGAEMSHITYKEPDVMEEKGMMYGLAGFYAYRSGVVFKTDGRLSFGQLDYSSDVSGSMDNIDDLIVEARETAGFAMSISDTVLITPYIGLGYRYLNDDSSEMVTSTGARGYERESNYFYSPIGIECLRGYSDGWSYGFTVEYDYFIKGVQKSHLSDANLGFADLENDQNNGYGFRASLKFKRENKRANFVIEPFVRYWNIKKSEEQPVSFSGVIIGTGYEPKNNSTEIGIKLAVKF